MEKVLGHLKDLEHLLILSFDWASIQVPLDQISGFWTKLVHTREQRHKWSRTVGGQ